MPRMVTPEQAVQRARDCQLVPLEPYPGRTDLGWRCRHLPCGTEVLATLANITAGKVCSTCGRQKISASRRADPESCTGEFVARGFRPLVPFPGRETPWLSVHEVCGEVVEPRLSNLQARPGTVGCSHCRGDSIRAALVTPETQAVGELYAAGLYPIEPYIDSRTPWRAVHLPCGREVRPRLQHVRAGVGICRPCAHKALAKARSQSEESAAALLAAAGWAPTEPYPGTASSEWKAVHLCGHAGSVIPKLLVNGRRGVVSRQGCIGCRPERVGASRRQIFAEPAAQEMRSAGFQPLVEYPGSGKEWLVEHEACGARVHLPLDKVREGQPCPACSSRKSRATRPCSVYVVTNGDAHKLGIASSRRRVVEHTRQGWEVFKTVPVPTGRVAYRTERVALRRLRREFGAQPFYGPGDMPQGGGARRSTQT